jgi:hypothetical protein
MEAPCEFASHLFTPVYLRLLKRNCLSFKKDFLIMIKFEKRFNMNKIASRHSEKFS